MKEVVRRFAAPGAVVLALALAVAIALLAADVLRWERQVDRGDLRYASDLGQSGMWTPDTILPAGVSRMLLGVDDDLAFRNAVQRFWLSRPRAPVRRFADVTRRSGAERELARLVSGDASGERRSVIANLRGVLVLEETRGLGVQRSVLLRRAIEHFRQAVTLSASNDDAKFNLELAMKMLRNAGRSAGGGTGGRPENVAPGAGAATSGGGY
jgi:hypothetical protein